MITPTLQDYFRDVTRDDIRQLLPRNADGLADPAFLLPPLGRSLEPLGDDLAAGASAATQKRLIAMRTGAAAGAAADDAVGASVGLWGSSDCCGSWLLSSSNVGNHNYPIY